MECEIIPRHRKLQRKKYHVDLSQDPEIKETTEVYQAKKKRLPTLEKVNEEDMFRILDRYAKDKKLDLYTIAECFDISASALNTALKSTIPDAKESTIELCLSHAVGNKVQQAYNRGDYFEERKRIMQIWCDFVEKTGRKYLRFLDSEETESL